jgi:hypothetical protein
MAKQLSHDCSKQAEITRLEVEVEYLNDIIKDNGQLGLHTTVIKLTETSRNLCESVESLKTTISGINKFMYEYEGDRKRVEKNNIAMKWIVGTLLTIIVVLFGSGIFT